VIVPATNPLHADLKGERGAHLCEGKVEGRERPRRLLRKKEKDCQVSSIAGIRRSGKASIWDAGVKWVLEADKEGGKGSADLPTPSLLKTRNAEGAVDRRRQGEGVKHRDERNYEKSQRAQQGYQKRGEVVMNKKKELTKEKKRRALHDIGKPGGGTDSLTSQTALWSNLSSPRGPSSQEKTGTKSMLTRGERRLSISGGGGGKNFTPSRKPEVHGATPGRGNGERKIKRKNGNPQFFSGQKKERLGPLERK